MAQDACKSRFATDGHDSDRKYSDNVKPAGTITFQDNCDDALKCKDDKTADNADKDDKNLNTEHEQSLTSIRSVHNAAFNTHPPPGDSISLKPRETTSGDKATLLNPSDMIVNSKRIKNETDSAINHADNGRSNSSCDAVPLNRITKYLEIRIPSIDSSRDSIVADRSGQKAMSDELLSIKISIPEAKVTDAPDMQVSPDCRRVSLDSNSVVDLCNTPSLSDGKSDVDPAPGRSLKELMIYKTVQFMDYRRLCRRFNGIRKPVSNKKALFVCLFCVALALSPFVYFHIEDEHYIAGIQILRGPVPYISSIGFVIGAFLLAKIQLSLQLKWPIIISYIFMFATLISMTVMRRVFDSNLVWLTLMVYTSIQIVVIILTKVLIFVLPILALNGQFCPCTEHFHLLQRTQRNKKLSITISRYNDYATMCGVNFFGFCTCFYRCFYRWLRWCFWKCKRTTLNDGGALFSHQMRYNGDVDDNGLPHGYGEWLEDHTYGERLRGYWWHGYPIGPFSSQEMGSGSLFVNTRVAFVTGTHLSIEKIRFGVASTECSVSGYFFKEMPKTYFFNPKYRETTLSGTVFYKRVPFFDVLSESYDDIPGSSPEWCLKMLRLQFCLNMPAKQGFMNIFVDKLTNSLRIAGYRRVGGVLKNRRCDEVTIRLTGSGHTEVRAFSKHARPVNTAIRSLRGAKKRERSFEQKYYGASLDGLNKLVNNYTHFRSNSSEHLRVRGGIAHLFHDEDEWDIKQHTCQPQITANGWVPMSLDKFSYTPEQALIYIHGYNLTLSEACAQMAHIVSFSKLPPYILPFVFNWDGHHLGRFSAFGYPLAYKCAKGPNLSESFVELLQEFICLGIKHIHILVHSCGARVFFNVLNKAITKGLITPVLEDHHLIEVGCVSVVKIRMDTCILINPDYSMNEFRDYDYFLLRGYCNHIVMYVDSRDQCLTFSELYNRERSLGRSIFGMCTTRNKLNEIRAKHHIISCIEHENEPFTIYTGEVHKSKMETVRKGRSTSMVGSYVADISQNDDCQCNAICQAYYSNWSNENQFFIVNRYNSSHCMEDEGDYNVRSLWLDMDVIDTTSIDTNVDFLKHSFYQMKREIMDDIRDVILMHTRAEYRQTRLDRRRGNVYVFRVAPSNVNNLFGS